MMYEGKHLHFSPVDNKPLCSYSAKLCKQRRLNGYAFCIRHILEDKSAPFKQCAHVAKYNNQKCTNPIPSNEDREYCNSHMQVAGMAPKKERKPKKEKDVAILSDGKVKFADRLKALIKTGTEASIDEPISIDDPYIFHESLPEMSQEKSSPGSVGSSPKAVVADPVVKTTFEPVAMKSDSSKLASMSLSTESKLKSTAAKSSKTMNRLQAKIAQNKILDKLKKNQESSLNLGCVPCHPEDMNFVLKPESAHSTAENVNGIKESNSLALSSASNGVTCIFPVASSGEKQLSPMLNCSSIKLEPPERAETPNSDSKSKPSTGTVNIQPYKHRNNHYSSSLRIPGLLRHVQANWESRKNLKADLYPLGTELTDTDGEESDSEPVQRHWFYSWDKNDFEMNATTPTSCRVAKLSSRQCEMRRSYNQMCKSHAVSETYKPQASFLNSLINSARRYPSKTADVLQTLNCGSTKPKKILKSTGLIQRYCCYRNDKDICESIAVPFTRHCLKHITYNVDQLLFEHCTAKFADNTQCCVPVFDICHELPLCAEHARKRDNYNKMSAEPKPKKPRKKTKPSALTRPPKRGKKKKKQNGIRPNKLPVPAIQSNIETVSSVVSDSPSTSNPCIDTADNLSPGPTELHAEDIAKDLDDHLDSDLGNDLEGNLSPGSIEKSLELPLDTAELANQATRLLEDHDFTEVLNKIPDDAFNDLFTESKNGDFLPTKEETEELERALAAVDKDVKSLEKFSVENNDMNELASSMDLHNSLLNSENLAHAMDESTLSELTQDNLNMDNLNVITSSLTTNDLNSISQVLSNITTDTLVPNSLPANLVDGAILQNHHLSGVHLVPELVQGQLQLQVPVGATQAANFVLSPQLLGATFSTDGTTAAGNFSNGSTIPTIAGAFPQTLTQTIPLATTPDGISISLQSQLQGIRAGQWILSPADPTFTPMVYQNGFPLSTQPFAQQVSTLGNLKFPFQAAVDVLKQAPQEQEILNTVDQTQTFSTTVNGNPLSTGNALASATLTNAFPVQSTDSPKETVS